MASRGNRILSANQCLIVRVPVRSPPRLKHPFDGKKTAALSLQLSFLDNTFAFSGITECKQIFPIRRVSQACDDAQRGALL